MRTPVTKSQHEQSSMSSTLKRTRTSFDVGDQAHSVLFLFKELLRPTFNSRMTSKSMLNVCDYDHPSVDDAL